MLSVVVTHLWSRLDEVEVEQTSVGMLMKGTEVMGRFGAKRNEMTVFESCFQNWEEHGIGREQTGIQGDTSWGEEGR